MLKGRQKNFQHFCRHWEVFGKWLEIFERCWDIFENPNHKMKISSI